MTTKPATDPEGMAARYLSLLGELDQVYELLTPGERLEVAGRVTASSLALAVRETSSPTRARERLPLERRSITKSWRLAHEREDGSIGVMKLYFIASVYPDGRPGEVFVKADKAGSTVSGALDGAAIMVSLLLQHGVPLGAITSKLRGTKFPPSGFTKDPQVPSCGSPLDLLAQWLDLTFGKPEVVS